MTDDRDESGNRWSSTDKIDPGRRTGQGGSERTAAARRTTALTRRGPRGSARGSRSRPCASKRVLIIGAGMAGLVAAYELKRQGHDPVVLEAQHRVGGRIYTLRSFAPGLYAEAGAMRTSRTHDLTLEYCRLFNLLMREFRMGNPKGLVFIGGERMTAVEANEHPERLPFNLTPSSTAARPDPRGATRSPT